MKYYVTFEAASDCAMPIFEFGTRGGAIDFIEEKINKYNYDLSDFKVIYGTKLSLETEYVPVRIFIKNPS